MPQLTPWHRYDTVVASDALPQDPRELTLFYLVHAPPPAGFTPEPGTEEAYELFQDEEARHALSAMLLFKADMNVMSVCLQISPEALEVFEYLFFDRALFPNAFVVRRFIRGIAEQFSEAEKAHYDLAMNEGPDRLLDRYRIGARPGPDPKTVLVEMMQETHSRAFEHRGRPLTSRAAQEAFKWGRAAAANAATLLSSSASGHENGTISQLKLALVEIDHTKTLTDVGATPEDILKA